MKCPDENDRASFLEEAAREAEINRIRAAAARACADEYARLQEQRRRAGSA